MKPFSKRNLQILTIDNQTNSKNVDVYNYTKFIIHGLVKIWMSWYKQHICIKQRVCMQLASKASGGGG